MSQNGKGDKRRPKSVDYKTWEKNYENIFGKKEKNSRLPVDKPIKHDRIQQSKRGNQSRD
jgi:hypothetical protein